MKLYFGNKLGWMLFDLIKREFFNLIRERVEGFDWGGERENFLNQFDSLFDEVSDEWMQMEERLGKSPRLGGLLYEILFYLMALRDFEVVSKASWIMRLYDEKWLADLGEPPFHSIIPIYEPIPRLFLLDKGKKVPQLRADFLILSIINGQKYDPVFVDVKSSASTRVKEEVEWTKIACEWHNCWFYIVYPKSEMPRKAQDWEFQALAEPR